MNDDRLKSHMAESSASGGCLRRVRDDVREARGEDVTYEALTIGEVITPVIRHYLDDPPPTAEGRILAYRQKLAWYFWCLNPIVAEADCRRVQFAVDLMWDFEHDRQSLSRRLPPLMALHLQMPPPKAEEVKPEKSRAEIVREVVRELKAAARERQASAEGTTADQRTAAGGPPAAPPGGCRQDADISISTESAERIAA